MSRTARCEPKAARFSKQNLHRLGYPPLPEPQTNLGQSATAVLIFIPPRFNAECAGVKADPVMRQEIPTLRVNSLQPDHLVKLRLLASASQWVICTSRWNQLIICNVGSKWC